MLILATDTFLLGHLSKEALAAAALANQVFFMVWLVGMGPAAAVPAMIAHIRGARESDTAGVRNALRMGMWSVMLLTPLLLLSLVFTREILLLLGQDAVLADNAEMFMSALMWSLPTSLAFQVLRNFATAVGRPMVPLIVSALMVLLNAGLGYALIFGHFGLPQLGLFGSGLGSALAQLFGFIVMLVFCLRNPALKRYRMLRRWHRPHRAHLREVFHLGMPIGLTMMFEVALFVAAAFTMGLFGADMLAAHQIAITVPSLTFMIPMGIGMAATVRVGLAMGAGDHAEARIAGFAAMGLAAVFMAVSSAFLLLFPGFIADGLQVTAVMSLRGLKDARAPMWIAGASYWLVGFPICLALGFGLNMQGLGIWYGLAAGLMVATVALVWRFNRLSKLAPSEQMAPQIHHQEE